MKKGLKIFLIIFILLVFAGGGVFCYFHFMKSEPVVDAPITPIKVTNSIDEYGYTLEDRDTNLFKETFEELKTLLNEETLDKAKYVELVSKLFIIDLFTINNKISRYDIGGTEYMYSPSVDSFKSVIENSIYKGVENNLDDSRKQELPTVSSVTIEDVSDITYAMPDDETVDGYRVSISWDYEKDLGYDDEAVLILVPDDKKVGVVFYKPKN